MGSLTVHCFGSVSPKAFEQLGHRDEYFADMRREWEAKSDIYMALKEGHWMSVAPSRINKIVCFGLGSLAAPSSDPVQQLQEEQTDVDAGAPSTIGENRRMAFKRHAAASAIRDILQAKLKEHARCKGRKARQAHTDADDIEVEEADSRPSTIEIYAHDPSYTIEDAHYLAR